MSARTVGTARRHAQAGVRNAPALPPGYDAFIKELQEGSVEARIAAGARLAERAGLGLTFGNLQAMAVLDREMRPGGRLTHVPEARLAYARLAAAAGDAAGARAALREASRLAAFPDAGGAPPAPRFDRNRAALVNREACHLYGQIGDAKGAEERWMVYRYYRATPLHRANAWPVHRQDRDAGTHELAARTTPAMGRPAPRPEMPQELRQASGVATDQAPECLEPRFAPLLGIMELLHLGGSIVNMLRLGHLWKQWDRTVEAYARSRKYYEAPPRPEEVSAISDRLGRARASADPAVRRQAEQFASSVDLELLQECAVAYWRQD